MVTGILFELYRGDTYTRDLVISGFDYDIDELYLTVKKNETDKNYVIQKTINNGISIVDIENGVYTYNILFDSIDTENLDINKNYYFDIKLVSKINRKIFKKTLVIGNLFLKNNITRPRNEK